jgi:hypothetical protein
MTPVSASVALGEFGSSNPEGFPTVRETIRKITPQGPESGTYSMDQNRPPYLGSSQ